MNQPGPTRRESRRGPTQTEAASTTTATASHGVASTPKGPENGG